MEEIGKGIFIESNYQCVTVGAVLTDTGWVCIDTPPQPQDAQAWRKQLLRRSGKPILFVINTDAHRDRISGNAFLEAPAIAHEYAAAQILSQSQALTPQFTDDSRFSNRDLAEMKGPALTPSCVSFSESLTLAYGNQEIDLVARPSASHGSIWVTISKERILFTGDSLVVGTHPYMSDCASKPWLDALNELRYRYKDWKLVPGRGPVTNSSATEPVSEYVRTIRRRIASLHRAGHPRADVISLVDEFLPMFPFPPDQSDEVQRRIKAGLEAIYDEYRVSDGDE